MDSPNSINEFLNSLSTSLPIPESSLDYTQLEAQFDRQHEMGQQLEGLEAEGSHVEREYAFVQESDELFGEFITRCDIQTKSSGFLDDYDIGVKDNIAVAGVPMTCGSPAMKMYHPANDAACVTRLLDAGGRILGKTNMSEFASGGGDPESIRFGLSKNPFNEMHRTGGSSGGSAAAVGNGSVDIALGSDTGGSIRAPAAFCGLIGVKPTRGLVPHDGFVQYAKTLDTIGTITSQGRPAAKALEVMSRSNKRADKTEESDKSPDYLKSFNMGRQLSELDITIGLPKPIHGHAPRFDRIIENVINEFEKVGADVTEVKLQHFELALPSWLTIGTTEMGAYLQANGTNYWQLHKGRPEFVKAIQDAMQNQTDEIGNHVIRSFLVSRWLRETQYNKYYELAQTGRRRVTQGVESVLEKVDVLAMPTLPTVAPKIGDPYLEGDDYFEVAMHTAPFNLSGHPAMTFSAGTHEGLPVGIQLVGPKYREDRLFKLLGLWESIGAVETSE